MKYSSSPNLIFIRKRPLKIAASILFKEKFEIMEIENLLANRTVVKWNMLKFTMESPNPNWLIAFL